MTKLTSSLALCAALCLLGVGSASAALFDRGGGMIFDTQTNLTWLQNAIHSDINNAA